MVVGLSSENPTIFLLFYVYFRHSHTSYFSTLFVFIFMINSCKFVSSRPLGIPILPAIKSS